MSEDMARAVGSEGTTTVTIAGKQCTARPLSIKELGEVERICLESYRRSYIKTFVDSMDLLPEGQRKVEEALERAARWDIGDLPPKQSCDHGTIQVTDLLRDWYKVRNEEEPTDKRVQIMASSSLDDGSLSKEQYREMTNSMPMFVKIPYAWWWVTGCFEGIVTFVWVCFKHNGVTKEQVVEAMQSNQSLLAELAREIEHLTAPSVGNG